MLIDTELREKLYRPYIDVVIDCRKSRDISQNKLSEACGLSAKYVTLIESGRRTPSLEALLTLLSQAGADRSTAEDLVKDILDRLEWLRE